MLTAVTGINWGDEGKGRVIDLLAENADVVARYQGGDNAGHTVVTEQGKFILNLLPSGILHPEVTCVLGAGMVIDLDHLSREIDAIEERGVIHCHIADRARRFYPAAGDGSEGDYKAFFAALQKSGYDGRVSIEGRCEDFARDAEASFALLDALRRA